MTGDNFRPLPHGQIAGLLAGDDRALGVLVAPDADAAVQDAWGRRWRELATEHLVDALDSTLPDGGLFVIEPGGETPEGAHCDGVHLEVVRLDEHTVAARTRRHDRDGDWAVMDHGELRGRYREELADARREGE